MKCICAEYAYNEQNEKYQDYWIFQKKVFMGELYKCKYCNSLWIKYVTGHGWCLYYKIETEAIVKEQIISIPQEFNDLCSNIDSMLIWKELLNKAPKESTCEIAKVVFPDDVMSVLKYLFKDVKTIKRWLFTDREKCVGFITPISLATMEGGMNIVRSLLLKKYLENKCN